MKHAIKVQGLTIDYENSPVVWDINAAIPQGAFAAILGPNGAGKTTLLKAFLDLVPKTSGSVHILGHAVEKVFPKIAYIPQRQHIDWNFPISVEELVLMGCYHRVGLFRSIPKAEKKKAAECLDLVHMGEFAHRQINELSGGQQQRAFLARALMQDALLYLLDEALSGVDHASSEIIMGVLNTLRLSGKTICMVYHDLNSVTKYFDFALLLNVRLIAAGPIKEVFSDELLQATYGKNLALFDATKRISSNLAQGLKT